MLPVLTFSTLYTNTDLSVDLCILPYARKDILDRGTRHARIRQKISLKFRKAKKVK